MIFKNLWLYANIIGWFAGLYISISMPLHVTEVLVAWLPLTAAVWVAIKIYTVTAYVVVFGFLAGAILIGCDWPRGDLRAGNLFIAAILTIIGSASIGSAAVFDCVQAYCFFVIALGLCMINVGGTYRVIEAIEDHIGRRRQTALGNRPRLFLYTDAVKI